VLCRRCESIAFIPLAIWLSRRYGERLSRSSILRHIADLIAGRDIAAAREYIAKLRRFGHTADWPTPSDG
jgi:hypothetical protein